MPLAEILIDFTERCEGRKAGLNWSQVIEEKDELVEAASPRFFPHLTVMQRRPSMDPQPWRQRLDPTITLENMARFIHVCHEGIIKDSSYSTTQFYGCFFLVLASLLGRSNAPFGEMKLNCGQGGTAL